MKKKRLGSTDIFLPCPITLVASGSVERPNVAPVAWVGMVSSTPPTIGISLDKRRYTLELIRESGEFTVNIPNSRLAAATDYCGMTSGRSVMKFEQTGLTAIPGNLTHAPIIEECPFNLECRVVGEMELGDYILILGEVIETQIDENKLSVVGNQTKVDVAAVDPLIYAATIREYWSIGRNIGEAFKMGKDLRVEGEVS